MYRSFQKLPSPGLAKLIPEIEGKDLVDGGAGVRAQAVTEPVACLMIFHHRI